jgi:hypothetical protein
MLTDEELTTRLSAAFQEAVPELAYSGPVPHVRRSRAGLAATSVMAATAALVLVPAALQREDSRVPHAVQGNDARGPGPSPHHRVVRTLELGGVHLSFATTDGDPGPLWAVLGNGLQVPPDAEEVELGLPVRVWLARHPTGDDPQVYVGTRTCPDTTEGCGGEPPQLLVYGILAPGWTRDQLIQLLEHPVAGQRDLDH